MTLAPVLPEWMRASALTTSRLSHRRGNDDAKDRTMATASDRANGPHIDPVLVGLSRMEVAPHNIVSRRERRCNGMAAELVQLTEYEPVEFRFHAPLHLLVVVEEGVRVRGETSIEGLPRSTIRDLRRRLSFVPAGHRFHETQQPAALARMICFYFDPNRLAAALETDHSGLKRPRLLFEDMALWETALKLKRLIECSGIGCESYLEALSIVLTHELARPGFSSPQTGARRRGGLAPWQQHLLADYIEENLAEPVSLAELAKLVRLSRYHLCRVFKETFGVPPHHYHSRRRIERAKALLSKPKCSVTQIGLAVGFRETSSFSAAFRKATGLTPSAYHRSLT